jgi:hypothetical protein
MKEFFCSYTATIDHVRRDPSQAPLLWYHRRTLGHITCEHYKAIQELYKHHGPDIPNNDIRVMTNTQNCELSSTMDYE